ncbi:MAG: glycosyltransferase family 39 protein [Phycisphaerae bacterium]
MFTQPSEADSSPGSKSAEFFGPHARTILICILFVCGFWLRLDGIADPPLRFHGTRQFRSALIARAYYYGMIDTVSQEKKRAATVSAEKEGVLEPPIMEWLAAIAYRLGGAERLWLPRLMSALFWLVGGVFVYLIALRLMSPGSGVFAAAFYIFLPYGIDASRSFQPDPLMVMLFLGGVLLTLNYFDAPSVRRLALAIVVAAAAMFIKPVCLFPMYTAFLALAVLAHGVRRALTRKDVWVYCGGSLVPTILYYIYGIFIGGFLGGQARASFMPRLWGKLSYWEGWLDRLEFVLGSPAILAALVSVLLARPGRQRTVLSALWIGYACYGLVFNYHIHTHDYYHLPFIPIAALSLLPLFDLALRRLSELYGAWLARGGAVALMIVGICLSLYQADWRVPRTRAAEIVEVARAVGASVGHSDKTVFLAHHYGKPLQYYGEIAGVNWPDRTELRARRLRGRPQLTARQRLDRISTNHPIEFFIVTNLRDFARQRDLNEFLHGEFPLLVQDQNFLIFDLRGYAGDTD